MVSGKREFLADYHSPLTTHHSSSLLTSPMICPTCGHDNLPGSEECSHCQMDMTQLDRPIPSNRIERSLMDDPVTVLRPRRPVAVRSSTTVGDTIKMLLENEIGALLVV